MRPTRTSQCLSEIYPIESQVKSRRFFSPVCVKSDRLKLPLQQRFLGWDFVKDPRYSQHVVYWLAAPVLSPVVSRTEHMAETDRINDSVHVPWCRRTVNVRSRLTPIHSTLCQIVAELCHQQYYSQCVAGRLVSVLPYFVFTRM